MAISKERLDAARAEARRLEHEAMTNPDEPYPPGTVFKRPNRATPFSVRLSADELSRLRGVAERRHLPVTTLARSWLLERLDDETG